jgi:hypothetical protein
MIKITHTYALKDATGALTKDGVETICPYAPRIPFQEQATLAGQANKINWGLFPCSITCPMCNITEDEHKNRFIEISCGGSLVREPLLSPTQQEKPKEKGKLISL